MTEPTLNTLTERLDRLERQNRWLKITATIGAASLSVVLLAGGTAPSASDIVAKSLRIIDSQGRPAITLAWIIHER